MTEGVYRRYSICFKRIDFFITIFFLKRRKAVGLVHACAHFLIYLFQTSEYFRHGRTSGDEICTTSFFVENPTRVKNGPTHFKDHVQLERLPLFPKPQTVFRLQSRNHYCSIALITFFSLFDFLWDTNEFNSEGGTKCLLSVLLMSNGVNRAVNFRHI